MKRGRPSHVILYFRKPAHLIKEVVNLSDQEINKFKEQAKNEVVPYEFTGTRNCTTKLDPNRFSQQVIPISDRVILNSKETWIKYGKNLQHDLGAVKFKLQYNG